MRRLTPLFLAVLGLLWGGPAGAAKGSLAGDPVWTISGLDAPESAHYDPGTKALYISNVGGSPMEKDARGWITKADLSGKVITERWVEGLNAPKGLRACGGRLYVADIDRVMAIDLKTGAIMRRIDAPGAKMLNDTAVDSKCDIFVSDTLGSRIYRMTPKGGVEVFAEGDHLESPNGLLVDGGKLYVAAWGLAAPDWSTKSPGRLYAIDLKTRKITMITGPLGNLDGLERDGGSWLVSDWVAGRVYRVSKKGESILLVLAGLAGPADLGLASSRKLLIVPRMKDNAVSAYNLKSLRK